PSPRATVCGGSSRARPRTTCTGSRSGCSFSLCGCAGPGERPMPLASFPILSVITWSPFVGALLIMFLARRSAPLVRWLAVLSTAVPLVLSIAIVVAYDREAAGFQFFEDVPLVPALGINYQLGVDGLSLLMVLLTSIIIFAG